MRKLIFTLIAFVLFSPAANAAVKWNNSSSSNSSSNENSAAWWAKTKNMKKGFFCQGHYECNHTMHQNVLYQC